MMGRWGAAMSGLVALLLTGGAVRLVQLGGREGETFRSRAERQQTARLEVPALRGEILDTRGRVLAGTLRRASVFVDPALVENARFAAHSLAPVLGLTPADLERDLLEWRGEGKRFVWLKRRISDAEHEAFEKIVDARRLEGFRIQYEPTRVYPQHWHSALAPHLLGFVGVDVRELPATGARFEDLRGLAGIEAANQDLLAGTPAQQLVTVDVWRQPVRAPIIDSAPAADGRTLVLTIDAYVQEIAQDALRAAVEKHRADWGTAVVMDPQTGEVLAMATMPDFDPADPIPPGFNALSEKEREAKAEIWRNRAVCDSYEPGSIFKPIVAASALNDGLARMDEVFAIHGPAHNFGRRTMRDVHAYDRLTFHEIISKSSNIGMGLIGARCGSARLHDYLRNFGFGEATGIGLPGEHPGQVWPLEQWNPGYSPQSVCVGQEVAVTALQMVRAYSVFCNGGRLLKPRIIRGVLGPDGTPLIDNSEPVVVREVLRPDVAERFRTLALVETVTDGTGTRAALAEYQVFGKSGTAQIARPKGGGYQDGAYVASFIGGAPSDDPRVVVLVSIYRPRKDGYYGGVIAAPVVREILAETLAYLRVPPELEPRATPAARHAAAPTD